MSRGWDFGSTPFLKRILKMKKEIEWIWCLENLDTLRASVAKVSLPLFDNVISSLKEIRKKSEGNCQKSLCPLLKPEPGDAERIKANFLWPAEDGSIEAAGYEFANAKTEAYQKQWWGILLATAKEEVQKKPEPTEFNTTNEYSRLAGKKRSELTGAEIRLLEACKEIDRLTADRDKWQSAYEEDDIRTNGPCEKVRRLSIENEAFKREKAIWIQTHNQNIERIQELTAELKTQKEKP